MPVKTNLVTGEELKNIPLPNHGGRYAVIPHAYIIDNVRTELQNHGLQIINTQYKSTLDGQVAQGIYKLSHSTDPDMGMMFAWSNSYNKMLRFKCAVGAQVFVCMNGVVSGDMQSYSRKHTGSALHDVDATIVHQLNQAVSHYNLLIQDKEMLKNVILSPKEKGTILGRLFAEEEILTLTQTGIVKREMFKPSFKYNCDKDSAWAMYNHITHALKESHPLTYLTDHQRVHEFFVNEYGQLVNTTPVVQEDPVTMVYDHLATEKVTVDNEFGVSFI